MITPQEIENIISKELDGKDIKNWHGIDLKNIHDHLIRPVKIKLVNPLSGLIEEHWLVLDEVPDSKSEGYLITYSEMDKGFALALKQNGSLEDIGTFLSAYNTFIEALNAM